VATVLLVDPALAGILSRMQERLPDVAVDVVPDFSSDALAERAADALVYVNARRAVDEAAVAAAPNLRLVQQIGVGFDSLDLAALSAAGVAAAFNPGVNTTGAAEHTLMLILALIKRLPAADSATRAGRFEPGAIIALGIDDLAGSTVGIVGMGAIGRAVAARLLAFGPRIVYQARRRVIDAEDELGVEWLPLDDLLAVSSIVTLHVPLTPETRGLIGARELGLMRPGAWLINAGRGGLVDEAALRSAIESGHLAGAALDVLEREADGGNPFADLPQVLVTPHLGGGSRNSMVGVVERCAANVERLLAGEPLVDQID
jgi:phosphoglycerate dehydrogenase-like enzyme